MIKELLKEMSDEDLMELDRLLASAENALKQRKPMTEEEINRELPFECSGIYFDGFRAGVRFAEKHHQIGIDKSDPDSIDLQSRCRGDKP